MPSTRDGPDDVMLPPPSEQQHGPLAVDAVEVCDAPGDCEVTGLGDVAAAGNPEAHAADCAKLNSIDRRDAVHWLACKPLGALMAMRYVIEPLTTLLSSLLQMGGLQWDIMEEAKLVEHLKRSQGEGAQRRDFSLSMAADHHHENLFFQELSALYSSESKWSHIPADDLCVEFRASCFRLLSRAGCCIHQNLQHKHTQFPVRMFQLLHRPLLLPAFLQVPHCMLDDWSRDLLERHGTNAESLQKILLAEAALVKTSIASVEASHASIRRHLSSRQQTHVLDVQDSGAL